MVVYTFNVISLTKKTVNGVPDTVISALWERNGIDENGYSGSFKICTNFDTNEVGISTNYIEYSDLTKSNILSWVNSLEDMDRINESISVAIQRSRDNETKVESGNFPWEV